MTTSTIDPVCLFHGKRASEHVCLYCCIYFKTLEPHECATDNAGVKWDVCDTRECREEGGV